MPPKGRGKGSGSGSGTTSVSTRKKGKGKKAPETKTIKPDEGKIRMCTSLLIIKNISFQTTPLRLSEMRLIWDRVLKPLCVKERNHA